MRVAAISDVHGRYSSLVIPPCDLLISAGDYSFRGERHLLHGFHEWLNEQPARHIISLQGNHELAIEKDFQWAKEYVAGLCPRAHFIEEGLVEIEGLKIWCSAYTPFFNNWAYNKFRGEEIKKHWDLIPNDIDGLITHGPPFGILDEVYDRPNEPLGCEMLRERIRALPKLKFHVFGHIHSGHGYIRIDGVDFYNASICDEGYKPNFPVTEFSL